jgi:hypothetical protein
MTTLIMGSIMTSIFETTPLLEPLWWCIFTALAAIPIVHNSYYWTLNASIAAFVIFCLLFYCFTPFAIHTSIPQHMTSESVSYFEGGLKGFFSTLAPVVFLYIGIELIPLMSEDVHLVCIAFVLLQTSNDIFLINIIFVLLSSFCFGQPKQSIPKATMYCTYFIITISFVVVLVACSTVDIATIRTQQFPLAYGFSSLLGTATSPKFLFLLLPPGYLMASGYQFAFSRLLLCTILFIE